MKASEVIKHALSDFYCAGWDRTGKKSEFMCHAISNYLVKRDGDLNYTEFKQITDLFMPLFMSNDTTCLTVFLKRTNKRYTYLVNRYGDKTPATFAQRVQFWVNLISDLESQGL
jgi:hypothetical protein